MYLQCFILLIGLLVVPHSCQTASPLNSYNNFSEESHSYLRDVQLANHDTVLTINFENVNDKQFPFYMHANAGYKFNMEQFTEDFVQVSSIII